MIPKFFLTEIADLYIRENFKKLADYFRSDPVPLSGFKFFQITSPSSSPQVFTHNLGFIPKDLILTGITGGQTVSFKFDSFTKTTLAYTATSACVMRVFLGTYNQGSAL